VDIIKEENENLKELCKVFAERAHANFMIIATLRRKIRELGGDPDFFLSNADKEQMNKWKNELGSTTFTK
jgi:hypothetical protein